MFVDSFVGSPVMRGVIACRRRARVARGLLGRVLVFFATKAQGFGASSGLRKNGFVIELVPYTDPRVEHLIQEYRADILARKPGRDMVSVGTDTTSDAAAADAAHYVAPDGLFFGMFDSNELVGIGGLRCFGSAAQGTRIGEIKRMYVVPRARGRGIARQLLQALEDAAVAFGCVTARLDTVSVLTEARALYESAGWYEIDRYNDNPDAQHFFEKPLLSGGDSDGAFRRFAQLMGLPDEDLPIHSLRDRRIACDGPLNLRDLGGYAVSGSNHRDQPDQPDQPLTVRRGLVFRSDHLNALTDADRSLFANQLHVTTVHDFRLDVERERQPSLYDGPWKPTVLELSTSDSSQMNVATIDMIRDVLAGKAAMPGPTFWEDAYESMLADARPMFVKLFRSLAASLPSPSLHHCTGGKDRTGVSTALLYRVLGVSDDSIIDDFLATNLYRTPVRLAALHQSFLAVGVVPLETVPILGVTRSALIRALSIVDNDYGGAERYLVDGGLEHSAIDAIRANLLAS